MSLDEHLTTLLNGSPSLERMTEQVRQSLTADMCLLMLLDDAGTTLQAVASSGLDRTLRSAVRVPVGSGFTGAIAADRTRRSVEEISDSDVLEPMFVRHGIHSLLGVPLVLEGRLLGVLSVGFASPSPSREADVTQLDMAAQLLAVELHAQMVAAERTAAGALQRSLLPTTPSKVPGFEFAARYIPAEGSLGGDWFDVFALPDGSVGMVMGDVVGHGLEAAIVMGRLRSALRAYALTTASPAQVLSSLDRKLCHFETGIVATAIYGVCEPPYTTLRFSSAGHWPPLMTRPGGQADFLPIDNDPLLGFRPDTPRRELAVDVNEGDSLLLYTDGLIDRPPLDGIRSGLDDLSQRMREVFDGGQGVESLCTRLVAELVGDSLVTDDIALLIARRVPPVATTAHSSTPSTAGLSVGSSDRDGRPPVAPHLQHRNPSTIDSAR